ncbi:MAG: glycosyltransferase [Firmicutes bacterium]|nr:glycosyltransferase [Bacillota bacterium]
MKILVCNERFLFRFGVDRALLILSKGLKDAGHSITIMANTMDYEVVESLADQIITVPTDCDYLNLNEYTLDWLQVNWDKQFNAKTKPDIAIIGGWPFFNSIPFFESRGVKVVFFDCGAVPTDGFEGGALIIQKKLRKLRKTYIQQGSLVTAISNFICTSQSIMDGANEIPVKTIHLAADHMDMELWLGLKTTSKSTEDSFQHINKLKEQGKKIILCLGRWEPDCYKNSQAALEFIRKLHKKHSNIVLLVLAEQDDLDVDEDLKELIIPIGFPDDNELQNIMKTADLGISYSLWEGFNLPLAEMQWLGKPVLTFNVAAHPEVIVHNWFLCADLDEMVDKAYLIMVGQGIDSEHYKEAFKQFSQYFKWERAIKQFREVIEELQYSSIRLIIDVTNASRDPANSGVIRVTRRLGKELQSHLEPIFVIWDQQANTYVLPNIDEIKLLGQYNGPKISQKEMMSSSNQRVTLVNYLKNKEVKKNWLLFTETMNEGITKNIRRYARRNAFSIAAIFYDAIAVIRPDLCNSEVNNNHLNYIHGLAKCDVVIPISNFSASCLQDIWQKHSDPVCQVHTNLLPGEFGGVPRKTQIEIVNQKEKTILCVSTLEPRKNHRTLINACLLLKQKHPDINWRLVLVGNKYAGNSEIPEYVEKVSMENPYIEWVGVVDDETLHKLYEEAVFTVYPSIIEGFGMPIMESLWHGRPCICYNQGVMAEIASEGGCLTTDVLSEELLSEAIYSLLVDEKLYSKLCHEAVNRSIKTWNQYAKDILSIFLIIKSQNNEPILIKKDSLFKELKWETILYPNCICDNWQMNHSERLALTALLSRHKPKCSIEIGTYMGGSLSLISQYSEVVFSIDIDPSIPNKFKHFENVHFLTGPSELILPELLKELDAANIPVDFILIDGDHSAEGIKKDIQWIIPYIPKRPMFVMLHDSFNPECRQGMLEGQWENSSYIDWIDLDFIPGRLTEHGGGGQGEQWGGLALAYLKPMPRTHVLTIQQSAKQMFDRILESNNMEAL